MVTYTVHEPPNPPADRMDRAESLEFVKEGFTWSAALFAPIWLLVNRLWWPLAGYVIVIGALEGLRLLELFDPGWLTLASLGMHVLLGFEADTLRLWSLRRRGWRLLGSVTGRNAAECERRFFDGWLPDQPVIVPASGRRLSDGPPRATPVVGSLLGVRS